MDTSPKYIRMCDCPEVQGAWELADGDYFVHSDGVCVVSNVFGLNRFIKDGHHYARIAVHDGYKIGFKKVDDGVPYSDIQLRTVDFHFETYGNPVFIPRQDQIQGMMYAYAALGEQLTYEKASVSCPDVIVLDLKEFSEDDCKYNLETMEQLWLAFYMHEKHGKIWDDEKGWVKA